MIRKHFLNVLLVLGFAAAFVVILVGATLPTQVIAQDTAPAVAVAAPVVDTSQPAPVETVVVNQDVSIPYGQWIEDVGNILKEWLIPVFLGLLSWVITRYVPLPLRAITRRILATQAEQLLQKAVDYGINATAGASRNKTLEIHVANDVLRNATNYAIANGWPKLIDFMDGPEGILHKIFARLDLPENLPIQDVGLSPIKPTAEKIKKLETKNQNIPWVLQK